MSNSPAETSSPPLFSALFLPALSKMLPCSIVLLLGLGLIFLPGRNTGHLEIPQVTKSCKKTHSYRKHGDLSPVSQEPEATSQSVLQEEQRWSHTSRTLNGGTPSGPGRPPGSQQAPFTQTVHTCGQPHVAQQAPMLLLKRGWLWSL